MQYNEKLYAKNARPWWMGALIAVLVVGAVLYAHPFEHPRSLKNAVPLLDGWRYVTAPGGEPVAVDSLDYYIPFDVDGSMTLTRRMTEEANDPHLLLRLTYVRATVELDGALLYENLQYPPGENPGSGVYLIPLPADYRGRELKITLTSPYEAYAYSLDPIYFGDSASLSSLVIAHSARSMTLTFVLVIAGLVVMAFELYAALVRLRGRERTANFCLGLFSMLYGLWQVTTSDLFLSVYPVVFGMRVDMVLWYLCFIPLLCFLWLKCNIYRRLAFIPVCVWGVTSLAAQVGALVGLWTMPTTLPVTNLILIAVGTMASILVTAEIVKGNKAFRLLTPAFALLITWMVLSVVQNGELYTLRESLRASGILLFLFLAGVDGMRTLIAARRREQNERQLVEVKTLLAEEQLAMAEAHNKESHLLRHEIRHHVAALSVLQREGRLKEMGEYLGELGAMEQQMEDIRYCEHSLVNAILGKTAGDCVYAGVTFRCEAQVPASIPIPDGDLCTLLFNMLENAVEAARQGPEGRRWVELQMRVKNGFLVVACSNARKKGSRIYQRDGRFASTKAKGGHHGYGILAMRRVVEKYGSKLNIDYDDASFSVKTILKLSDQGA